MSRGAATGQDQRGAALILALLILALATLAASSMLFDSYLAKRRTTAVLGQDTAYRYLLGAEDWARVILDDDRAADDRDHLGEDWARRLPGLPVEGGQVTGHITDLQGRFNLNNLAVADEEERDRWQLQFRRLLEVLERDPRIADAVTDWVDADEEPRFPDGAESPHYFSESPAYGTADQPVTSASELLAVRGVDLETFRALEPHVSALPVGTPINVNTTTAPVLAALSEDMGLFEAESLLEDRPEAGYEDLEAFQSVYGRDILVPVSLQSSHYRLTAAATIGSLGLTMYSHLHRPAETPTITLTRSLNTP